MDWRPIETAPKDGSKILLRFPDQTRSISIGYWTVKAAFWHSQLELALGNYWALEYPPDEWMPLPVGAIAEV